MALSDYKIDSTTSLIDTSLLKIGVSHLPDRPTVSAEDLKRAFDFLAALAAQNLNGLIDYLDSNNGGQGIGVVDCNQQNNSLQGALDALVRLIGSEQIASVIPDGGLQTGQIADSAINTDKLADESVTTDKLAQNAVGIDQMQDASVGTDELVNGAVTREKLGFSAVGTSNIEDGSVTTPKIGSEAVTNAKLAANAVTTSKIADNQVSSAKLSPGLRSDISDLKLRIKTITKGFTDGSGVIYFDLPDGFSWDKTAVVGGLFFHTYAEDGKTINRRSVPCAPTALSGVASYQYFNFVENSSMLRCRVNNVPPALFEVTVCKIP